MASNRNFRSAPSLWPVAPVQVPMPLPPPFALPAATIHTSLRWQRLLASQQAGTDESQPVRMPSVAEA